MSELGLLQSYRKKASFNFEGLEEFIDSNEAIQFKVNQGFYFYGVCRPIQPTRFYYGNTDEFI